MSEPRRSSRVKAQAEAPQPKPAEKRAREPKEEKPEKPAPAKKAKANPDAAAQKKAREEVSDCSLDELKAMLRLNDMVVGGTRTELLSRVVSGIVKGALPRCPTCHGGKLKVVGAQYKCPGFYDDDQFVNCRAKFAVADIPRVPWKRATDTSTPAPPKPAAAAAPAPAPAAPEPVEHLDAEAQRRIVVKTLTGKSIVFDITGHTTVEGIKELIVNREGIPVHYQQLILKGQQLKDERTAHEYSMVNDSVIHLVLKLRG